MNWVFKMSCKTPSEIRTLLAKLKHIVKIRKATNFSELHSCCLNCIYIFIWWCCLCRQYSCFWIGTRGEEWGIIILHNLNMLSLTLPSSYHHLGSTGMKSVFSRAAYTPSQMQSPHLPVQCLSWAGPCDLWPAPSAGTMLWFPEDQVTSRGVIWPI